MKKISIDLKFKLTAANSTIFFNKNERLKMKFMLDIDKIGDP